LTLCAGLSPEASVSQVSRKSRLVELGRANRLDIVLLKDGCATRQLVLWARRFSGLSPHAKLLAEALAPDDSSSSVGMEHVLDLGSRE
jgi:hypothetical protein